MDRSQQLEHLDDELAQLVAMLSLDQHCRWKLHFEHCHVATQELLTLGADERQLNALSSSITSVFGGSGSFGDYAPARPTASGNGFEIIPGMENVSSLAGRVYRAALDLRVVGKL